MSYEYYPEIKKESLEITEKKIYPDYLKVIKVEANYEDFPLIIPHKIEGIVINDALIIVSSLKTDEGVFLTMANLNLEIKLDEKNITLTSIQQFNNVKGQLIIKYNTEKDCEMQRIIRKNYVPESEQLKNLTK